MSSEFASIVRYFKKYRSYYAVGIFALVVVDILEIFPPLLLKNGVDGLSAGTLDQFGLAKLALIYTGIALVQAGMRYLWRMYIVRTSMFAANDIRCEFFAHLMCLEPTFFKRKRIGDLISLVTNDIQNIRFVLGPTLLVACDALFYILSIVPVMIYLSPKLALLSLIPLLFVTPFVAKMEKVIERRFFRVQDTFSELASESQESLGGIRVIKGAALEPLKEKVFDNLGRKHMSANVDSAIAQTGLDIGLDFFVSVAISLLFVVGGSLVIGETVTIGTFVAFHLYIQKMTWPMEAIGATVSQLQRGLVSQRRLNEVYAVSSSLMPKEPVEFRASEHAPRIEIHNLTFTYPGQSEPTLRNISLTIEAGARIGIAGPIGSGKSTLLHCLARLEAVPRGTVFFDGVDATTVDPNTIRSWLAMVPQDPFLFSESVCDNVLYGSRHFSGDGELKTLATARFTGMAHVDREVESFPELYGTRLGERGLNISGGQKQRLTIARALAQEPKVLFFDDCLSAVDSLTEERLTNSFQDYAKNRTFVFSSHRVSSLLRMDQVIVMEHGKIVEMGKPQELLRRDTKLRALAELQRIPTAVGATS